MTSLADLAFDCPHCKGPLMAETSHAGMACECPHCYAQLQVPDGAAVNKDKFVEPPGLRRVLRQVRDQEWETLRRKFRAAKARTAEVEAELHRAQTALAERSTASRSTEEKGKDSESLRKQLAEMSDNFVQANQAFMAGRKQQDAVIDHLRHQLEIAREEAESFHHKNEALALDVQTAREELTQVKEQNATLEKQLAERTAEVERLRSESAEIQSKLEAEQAKVLVMEAAGVSPEVVPSAVSDGNEVLVQELQIQVAELRKSNATLRSARDKAHSELAALKQEKVEKADDHQHMEVALSHLEDGLNEVLELITARRAQPSAAAV